MVVTKASVLGVCQGVQYAINLVEKIRLENKGKVTLLGNLVHNELIMDRIKEQGIDIHVENTLKEAIDKTSDGIVIFSAHGHDPKLDEYAESKGLKVFDATCPRVKKNMEDINKALKNNHSVIYIGINNHPEANAALSLSPEIIFCDFLHPKIPRIALKNLEVFNQTTLSNDLLLKTYDLLNKQFENIVFHNDICPATTKRQNVINEVKDEDYIVILGDNKSSNTRRLFELFTKTYPQKEVLLFTNIEDVKSYKFDNQKKVFLSTGASTPMFFIDETIEYLSSL